MPSHIGNRARAVLIRLAARLLVLAFPWLAWLGLPVPAAAAGPEWPDEISGGDRLPDGTMVLVDDEIGGAIFLWDGDLTHPPVRHPFGKTLDDLEGVAADSSGAIYLLTSHSITKRGRVRPERRCLARWRDAALGTKAGWAADPGTIGGDFEVIDDLTPVLLRLFDTGASQLNLEGLAWYPPGDQLLLGARAPLREGKALVVGLRSASRLFSRGRSSQPTSDMVGGDPSVQALDLGGRGIRSLTHDPWRHAIWVLAGPPAEEGPTFALFLWDPESERIEAVAAPGLESLEQPECVMALGPPDTVSGETPLVVAGEGVRPVHVRARPLPVPPPPGEVR